MRLLAFVFAALLAAPSLAAPGSVSLIGVGGTAYQGPCDLVTCAEAYSVARAMKLSYTGPLFQLVRASDSATLDVGQASHVADLAGVLPFCKGTTCTVNKVYGQVNGNDLTPTNSGGGVSPADCATATACAPLFYIDPANGLPVIRTTYPTQLYHGSAATGVTGGASAISVYYYGRSEGWSDCCGFFGPAHSFTTTPLVAGTDFLPGIGYGSGHTYTNCSASNTTCAKLDIELLMTNGADLSSQSNQNVSYMTTFDGGSPGTIKVYVNGATPIDTAVPSGSTTMDVGTTIRIGGGGDGSHVDGIFREGLIANSALSAANFTSIDTNVSDFYAARSVDACSGSADLAFYFNSGNGGQSVNYAIGSTLAAYSLRRLSASYYGPIADIRDAAGTTNTYGPASSGCGIDPAAATFCAANAPCTVSKLYNQGTFSSQGVGNSHDTNLDLAQTTVSKQPSVTFSGLNGYPTMVFDGASSQTLCSSALSATASTYYDVTGFVAKRTGTFTSYNSVVAIGSSNNMGFNNTADNAFSSFTSTLTGAANDNAFHSVIWEMKDSAANAAKLTIGGSQANQGTASFPTTSTNVICIGSLNDTSFFLTGEIAEAFIGTNGQPAAAGAPGAATAAVAYAKQQAAWGL